MYRSRGFSLLEVLVAFAFFALAGTALHGVFSGALRNASAAEEHTRAALIAESRLAALGHEKILSVGTESGEAEGDKFRWVMEVRPYQAAPTIPATPAESTSAPALLVGAKLVEVEVVVTWPGPRNIDQRLVLTTLRLAPSE